MTVQVTAPQTSVTAPIPDPLEEPGIRQAPDGINLSPKEVDTTGRLTAEIKRALQGLLETDTFSVKVKGWNPLEPRGSYESPVLKFGAPALRTLNLEQKLIAFNLGHKIEVNTPSIVIVKRR